MLFPIYKTTCTLFLLVMTASLANGLHFKMHPRMFQASHSNITLTCSTADGPIKVLRQLQIQKLSLMDTWLDLVTLKHDGSLDSTLSQAVATGYMGSTLQSYLKITWPWASLQIMGKYRCASSGLTEEDKEEAQTVNLVVGGTAETTTQPVTSDNESQIEAGLEKTLSDLIHSSFARLSSDLDSRFERLQSGKCGAVPDTKTEESTMWPEGNFALLMPDSGCPLDPPAWDKGLKKMSAGNDDVKRKHDPYGLPLHLQILKTKNGGVYQQFCSMPSSPARQQPWPAGKYCINFWQKSCPAGFNSSLLDLGLTKTALNKDVGINMKKYELYSTPGVAFCCRHDGDPNSPIKLPVSKPFFLYRHQGTCQKVKDMEVIQDSLVVEILTNGKADLTTMFSSQGTDYRPDFSVSPLKKELCYYFNSKQATSDFEGLTNLNVILKKESQPRQNNLVYIEDEPDLVKKTTDVPKLPITLRNPKVPLVMPVDGLMVPGRKVLISGMPISRNERFNLFLADSKKNALALYIDLTSISTALLRHTETTVVGGYTIVLVTAHLKFTKISP